MTTFFIVLFILVVLVALSLSRKKDAAGELFAPAMAEGAGEEFESVHVYDGGDDQMDEWN